MAKYIIFIIGILFSINITVYSQIADFNSPDTVCINQEINIHNLSSGGSTYYWNFCSGDLSIIPTGVNLGNLGSLDRPVYSSIAKDGSNYYVFITNNTNGSLSRLAFGNSLNNTPIATNLGNFGMMGASEEGIEVKKDNLSGNWFALIIVGGYVDNLFRLNFGNSLNNIPTIENLGNVSNLINYGHTIYTFYENGKWHSFIGNYWGNSIIRLDFGNSLANFPIAISLGNVGELNGPVGLYPIQDNGQWYLFVANRDNSSLSRLSFGNSLLNTPSGVNLGNIDGSFNFPRSISLIRDCGKITGFIVNQGTSDIVRLSFPNGLLSLPTGTSLGNIADFSFPHHISELFRVGDSLFAFVMNVSNNTISRLCFASCLNLSIPSSQLQNPPAFSYSLPGKYNIRLVVDEGMPSQTNVCKEIVVVSPPIAEIIGDTTVCSGGTIHLEATPVSGSVYKWNGPNGYSSSDQNIAIANANTDNEGYYSLIVTRNGCSVNALSKKVHVIPSTYKPDITGDSSICVGGTLNLMTTSVPGSTYYWTGPNNYASSNQNISISNVGIGNAGIYSLKITASGCSSLPSSKIIAVFSSSFKPSISGDTSVCIGGAIDLETVPTPATIYQWTGPNGFTSSSQNVNIPKADYDHSGMYTLTEYQNNCLSLSAERNVNVIPGPIVDLGNDTSICQANIIFLNASNVGCTYNWSTGENSQIIKVFEPGTYSVTVSNGSCSSFDEILIDICATDLWFPNVFTPNNDGLNERFRPIYKGLIMSYQIAIFNRWGQQIYESSDASLGWNGTYNDSKCPTGTYYYIVEYSTSSVNSIDQKVKRGAVTLLR
jgi:gliding motility-associated-like protein